MLNETRQYRASMRLRDQRPPPGLGYRLRSRWDDFKRAVGWKWMAVQVWWYELLPTVLWLRSDKFWTGAAEATLEDPAPDDSEQILGDFMCSEPVRDYRSGEELARFGPLPPLRKDDPTLEALERIV